MPRPARDAARCGAMKIGFATPISLRFLRDLVQDGERLPTGYEFAPSVDWVRQLLKRGHEVTVYTMAKDIDAATTFRGERLTLRIAAQRPTGTGKDLAAKERKQLTRMMVEDRCDMIHAHWTYEFALAALSSRIPTLITVHDLPWNVLRFFRDKFRLARVVMAYRVALRGREFTAVSTDAASHFRNYFCPWGSIDVVSNGLPEDAFAITSDHPERTRARVFATVLQGWSNRKNGSAALEAFGHLRAKLPETRLILFGRDYEPQGPAWQWAVARQLATGVEFAGQVPYGELLRRVRCDVDALVHPSLDESFSMASLEAMAARKPVIAGRNTPGVREVLDYGRAGILLDVKDALAIAEAMERLATDDVYYRQMSARGFQRAYANYRTETIFDRYEAIYRRVLSEARRAA